MFPPQTTEVWWLRALGTSEPLTADVYNNFHSQSISWSSGYILKSSKLSISIAHKLESKPSRMSRPPKMYKLKKTKSWIKMIKIFDLPIVHDKSTMVSSSFRNFTCQPHFIPIFVLCRNFGAISSDERIITFSQCTYVGYLLLLIFH